MSTLMNARQAKFVSEYLLTGNGTQSAIRSGYGAVGAHVAAHRLLRNAKVLAAVQTGQCELAAKQKIDRDSFVQGLLAAVDLARAQGDPGAMIRAWSEIGRMCGFYAQERAVKVDVNIAAKRVIEQMETLSDEALLRLAEPEPS